MDERIVPIARRELGTTPDDVRRVAEGLLHETYELRCDEAAYVLQFAADGLDDRRDSLRRGVYWYDALGDSGVPVPAVVSDGVAADDGREYALVERRPGETAERDVSPERTGRAGRHLARIHEARTFERAGWIRVDGDDVSVEPFQEGSLPDHVGRVAAENATTLRADGLVAAATALDRVVDRLRTDLPREFRPVLCHGDFSPDNVLFRDGGVTGVIDFDRTYAGDAQRDLVQAANAFWMHDPCADWPVRERLYEGYRSVRDPGDGFRAVEPMYRVETLARTVAGMADLGELSDYERGFYDERIEEAAERAESRD